MRRSTLQVLACPECELPFREASPDGDPLDEGRLRCAAGHSSSIENGIPLLVRAIHRASVNSFAGAYARAWTKDGWGSHDPGHLASLPYRDTTGRHRLEWRVKARSMEALFAVMDERGPLRVVDLGCGMGWLAHHLALHGHEVYAVDALLDEIIGLGAARVYQRMGPAFERIWGELERPPFQSDSIDVVICNASLHYSANVAPTLTEFGRILRPGGRLVILNSPVYRDSSSALRGESDFRQHLLDQGSGEAVASTYHHFVRGEIEAAMRDAIGPVREIPFDPGLWFRWSRRAKGFILRMELASFPILIAEKPDAQTGAADADPLARTEGIL